MSSPVIAKVGRKRRSWYRRRLRIYRGLMAFAVISVIAFSCWQTVARHFGLPRVSSSQILSDSFWARHDVHRSVALMAAGTGAQHDSYERKVYPYSVIPGGVASAHELREAIARDYVVRRHFADFEFAHARLVRAKIARLVHMSYRKGDKIYWTKNKVTLHPGELLLTDGKTSMRARCGNQVSEDVKGDVAEQEPTEDVFDRPVAELKAGDPVVTFRSSLNRPSLPGLAVVPPKPPQLFASGFSFPLVPFGGGISGACEEKHDVTSLATSAKNKKCDPRRPPVVPEPSTWMFLSSGIAALCWRFRKLLPV